MHPIPPGGGPPLRPTPASTLDTCSGVTHQLRRARMRRQLARTVDDILQAGARIPSAQRLTDLDDDAHEHRIHQASRALVDRVQGFGSSLAGSTADAKAARAVVVPVLLGRYKAIAGWNPTYAMAVARVSPGESNRLFNGLCSRTLAALDLRANPRNLEHLLSQLAPPPAPAGGDADFAWVGHFISSILHALAQPAISQAHARQMVDFIMRPGLDAVPGPWLASAMRGLEEGWLSLRDAGTWPPEVDVRARTVECVAKMSRDQLQALGRSGSAFGALLGPALQQALPPARIGVCMRGVLQRAATLTQQPSALFALAVPDAAGVLPADFLTRYADTLVSREVLGRALDASPDVVFATACAMSHEMGAQRAQEVWDQIVITAERRPPPDAAQAALFNLGLRLAWAPLTVLGEPGLAMPGKLALLHVVDAVVGVPLSARGWTQLATIHQVDDADADVFVAPRAEPFIRQVFEVERDRAWAALLAAYPARKDPKDPDTKDSPARGFPAHVPVVAQHLTALLTCFDSYERRTGLDRPCQADDPRMRVFHGFLKTQAAWVATLRADTGPLREVRSMLRDRLARMHATLEEANEMAGLRMAFETPPEATASSLSSSITTSTFTTPSLGAAPTTASSRHRREAKGDEPDGGEG